MNKRISIPVVMAILMTILSGCSTIFTQYNFRNPPEPYNSVCDMIEHDRDKIPIIYSGTYTDIHHFILFPSTATGEGGLAAIPFYPMILIIGLVDLPFSFVLDTLMLPYTIPYSRSLNCECEEKARIVTEEEQKKNNVIYLPDTGRGLNQRAIMPHEEGQ